MKLFKLLVFLPFCLSCNQNSSDKSSDENKLGMDTTTDVYYVTGEDPSMNAAITKAKKTIGEFDLALASKKYSYTDFAVKKKYNTTDGGGEHMWVAGITVVNGNYKGFINNDAEKTKEVKYGDTVIVLKDEITDWMYLDNYVLKGGYTIREIRNRLSEEEKVKMDVELGFRVED